MFNIIMVAALAIMPAQLDLPPEGITQPATAETEAVRLDPPVVTAVVTPVAPTSDPCEEMAWYRKSVGLPARFDSIGYRESRCILSPNVRTSCCVGWWQLNVGLHLRDHRLVDKYHACGVYSYRDVDGPGDQMRHACATKALFDTVGYSAWSTS